MPDRPDPTLIRLCCDGEATPEQAAQLREYMAAHPECCCEIEAQMDCERKLRESIRKVMTREPCAPAALRQCICDLAEQPAGQTAEVVGRIDPAQGERQRQTALRSFFSNTQSANWIAIVATMMLIGGAVLFGIFGRTIDDVRPSAPTSDLVSEAAVYVDQEHRNAASANYKVLEEKIDDGALVVEAEQYLTQWLQSPVRVFDLGDAGYKLIGAQRGHVPVLLAPSGHLIYKKVAAPGERAPMLSVFMVRDDGQVCHSKLCEDQKSGTWSCLTDRVGGKCKKKVLRGTDGTLIYFVVCCDDKAVDTLAQSIPLGAPGTHR